MAFTQTADNSLYDSMSESWWDEYSLLNLLKTTVNPWRVPYFTRILKSQGVIAVEPGALKTNLLDVGCGGGLLAEEFAAMNLSVSGIDPSEQSLHTARAHALEQGLEIDYQAGFGDKLPFPDASFTVVSCCDVLEHIVDWPKTIMEISRVLKPGGIFLFDTINRTAYSWLVNIFIAQELPATRFMPKNMHVWNMFITPRELTQVMQRQGLIRRDLVGASPSGSPLSALKAIRRFKRGEFTARQVGAITSMRVSRNVRGSYMGYAIKSS